MRFRVMMTSWNGNIFRVTSPLWGESTGHRWFPLQRPVTRSFDVFFDVRLNKWLSKQSICWWYETPWRSLWRHDNVQVATPLDNQCTQTTKQNSYFQLQNEVQEHFLDKLSVESIAKVVVRIRQNIRIWIITQYFRARHVALIFFALKPSAWLMKHLPHPRIIVMTDCSVKAVCEVCEWFESNHVNYQNVRLCDHVTGS